MTHATEPGVTRLWRAEAMLRYDRRTALAELERCFVTGEAPEGLDGPLDGRLVTGTLGSGLDVLMEAMSRLWMPWRGKAFEAEAKQGRNRFAGGARAMFRLLWSGYRDLLEDGSGGFTAFRFDTSVAESVTATGLSVLKIDYDHPASPWPIRLILDELVHIGEGQHLGHALVRWRGGFRRVAWFALERPS